MHARSDSARNCTAMPSLPLFSLLCSSENCQNLRNASQDTGGSHRLSKMITGTRMWPIGTKHIHRPLIDCRSALNTAGRQWIPAEPATHSSRGQNLAWQLNSSNVCTKHIPYHVCYSKEDVPRFSGHQSRISMHDGQRVKMCNFSMEWNAQNK